MNYKQNLPDRVGNNPNVDYTKSFRSIFDDGPYRFMQNAYYGTGGFRDGNYLVPHVREMAYVNRKELAYYKNFVRPIVDAMINPIFSASVQRQVTSEDGEVLEDTLLNKFIVDADGAGSPLGIVTNEAVFFARLHGVSFVVVDNFPSEVMPEDMGTAADDRIFPYCYIKTAPTVEPKLSRCDMFGLITEIGFVEDPVVTEVAGRKEVEPRWGKWTKTEYVKYKMNKRGQFEAIDVVTHGLGVLPVVPVYAADRVDKSSVLVDPPLLDIARINLAIYNKDSEIRELERSQGFSIFYYQTDTAGDLVLGPNNVLFVPIESTMAPGFCSPDPNMLQGLVSNAEKLREDLFRIAQQNGVVADGASLQSGVSKSWDFQAHAWVLKKTSALASSTEYAITDIFKAYTGELFVYSVSYPVDFSPTNRNEIIANITTMLLDGDYPPTARALLKKAMLSLTQYLKDSNEETYNQAIDEIDADALAQSLSLRAGAGVDDGRDDQ